MTQFKIPLSRPYLGPEEEEAVIAVLRSGNVSQGENVGEFGRMVSERVGKKYAVSTNSGASALQIALMAAKIKNGVLIPSFTFPAVANAVIRAGAIPIFHDVSENDYCFDPQRISGDGPIPKIEAVIVVHHAGQCANIPRISEWTRNRGMLLIEDCAQALGATYQDEPAGKFGYISCFSFWATKHITTGEGGMLCTNDDKLTREAWLWANHGIDPLIDRTQYDRYVQIPGYNFRMAEINAAIGVEQMKKLDCILDHRKALAYVYLENLKGIAEIKLPWPLEGRTHTYHLFQIRVPEVARDGLVYYLRGQGIEAAVHYNPPLHLQEAYKKYRRNDDLSMSEMLSKEIISLPIYPAMKSEDVKTVCGEVRRFFGGK